MPTVTAFTPKFQVLDSSGNPGNAWKIYTYAPGTVTPQSSYTDSTGNTANANPVIADSRGEINLWLDVSLLYKIVVKDSSDVTIWTVDNFNPVYDNTDIYVATVGGTVDVITLTPTTPLAAYAAGQKLYFIASGANTTNVTVNVSGLGAKALTKNGATALVANDILSGALIGIQYDGTRFQIIGSVSVPASDTQAGVIEVAIQSEMETGSSTTLAVTPGRQQYHPSAAKAWLVVDSTGSVGASYNITSVTDTGTGVVDVSWDIDFSSAVYPIFATNRSNTNTYVLVDDATPPTASGARIHCRNTGTGALSDTSRYYVGAFGDQ